MYSYFFIKKYWCFDWMSWSTKIWSTKRNWQNCKVWGASECLTSRIQNSYYLHMKKWIKHCVAKIIFLQQKSAKLLKKQQIFVKILTYNWHDSLFNLKTHNSLGKTKYCQKFKKDSRTRLEFCYFYTQPSC